jgi:hypothetical protein
MFSFCLSIRKIKIIGCCAEIASPHQLQRSCRLLHGCKENHLSFLFYFVTFILKKVMPKSGGVKFFETVYWQRVEGVKVIIRSGSR